jgi:hypothetical protein
MTKSKDLNTRWTPGALRRLARYIKCDLDYRECAKLLDVSRNAVIGAVNRHGLQYTTEQALDHKRRAPYERVEGGRTPRWDSGLTDRRFIEPWAEYTARRQKEREATKASPQVIQPPQDEYGRKG